MIFIVMGIAYVIVLAFLVRFFQAAHRWDEEISSMEIEEEVQADQAPRPKAA